MSKLTFAIERRFIGSDRYSWMDDYREYRVWMRYYAKRDRDSVLASMQARPEKGWWRWEYRAGDP